MIYGLSFTMGHADSVWYNALSTNPHMSRANAMAYIDTIMGYLNPRIVASLNLVTGISDLGILQKFVSVYPNPATSQFTVKMDNSSEVITRIQLTDISG